MHVKGKQVLKEIHNYRDDYINYLDDYINYLDDYINYLDDYIIIQNTIPNFYVIYLAHTLFTI